ncbi:hypothetical protein GCM10018954_018720 [Kutzneria kofuensis]
MRTDLTTSVTEPDDVRLLDWAPARTAATIQTGDTGPEFFAGWRPPRPAADLLLLGAAVYCADKTTRRRATLDSWTRELNLRLPVEDDAAWQSAGFDAALRFLTGDHWQISPYKFDRHPLAHVAGVPTADRSIGLDVDGVCLFSGGLDSLCGVIDLLEEDPHRRLCLLSHHEGGQASTAQQLLLDELNEQYGAERIISRRLYLRPAPANSHQARALPKPRENTTRSRSLLFLTAALAIAAAEGTETPVYVPENGFIGINVPLTRSRVGSASTRTTHPHFMNELGAAATAIGVPNPILTRTGCAPRRDPRRIPEHRTAAPAGAAQRLLLAPRNCAVCRPQARQLWILLSLSDPPRLPGTRRMDHDEYAYDVFDEHDITILLNRRSRRGADLRAVIAVRLRIDQIATSYETARSHKANAQRSPESGDADSPSFAPGLPTGPAGP